MKFEYKKQLMKKKFNITGVCLPNRHFMVNLSAKTKQIMALIEEGAYFTINRPYQFGKTTILQHISRFLANKDDYQVIRLSFQGVDEKWHRSDDAFAKMFINLLTRYLRYTQPELIPFLDQLNAKVTDMDALSNGITELVSTLGKKLILLIDEVDASSQYLPFLNFLAMLRTKYLERFEAYHATFHSVILVGIHDIKSLKYKKTESKKARNNSPWNIAADFKVTMSFQPDEIAFMLEDYSQQEGVKLNIASIANKLYFYTSGYPFLVSKLCKIIAEEILPHKKTKNWLVRDVEQALKIILQENNTNFDGLIKNLENNPDLYELVHQILIGGAELLPNPDNPLINQGKMYGLFKNNNANVSIHNRIYEQRIYNYMISKAQTSFLVKTIPLAKSAFINKDNTLDVNNILLRFQEFMKEQHSPKMEEFLEKEWRVLFLTFLTPIINGKGQTFIEPQLSDERRLDIITTFYQHKYIFELKIWHGKKLHQEGLNQLAGYLDKQNQNKGWLLIFDTRVKKSWDSKPITHLGKEIFAVWV